MAERYEVYKCDLCGNIVQVLVGGDGTLDIGMRFEKMGVPVVGVPKAIDNDLAVTDLAFGLDTAVATATNAIDALHSIGEAHDRVLVLEGAPARLEAEILVDCPRPRTQLQTRESTGFLTARHRVYEVIFGTR